MDMRPKRHASQEDMIKISKEDDIESAMMRIANLKASIYSNGSHCPVPRERKIISATIGRQNRSREHTYDKTRQVK